MAIANLSSATKLLRSTQIINAIGSNGLMSFYTGAMSPSPDIAPTGTLLVSLPLATPAATASLAVLNGYITAPGTGGTDGTYALTITPTGSDPGTGATGIYTVLGGVLSSIQISNNGSGYGVAPTFSGFNLSGLTSATAVPVMTATLVFGAIGTTNGFSTGTTGFVRITTSGGVGILDLDVGTTNGYSVIMSNTFISSGVSVSCSADVLIEG